MSIKDAGLEKTGFNTMSLIQGKYKMFILYALIVFKVVPLQQTEEIKTLSITLKELKAAGLVHRVSSSKSRVIA